MHWVCAGQYARRAWDIISLDAYSNPASVCSHIARGETQRGWIYYEASQVAQRVKNPAGMQETRVQSLDWQDPLEEGMAIHSNILAWIIPWAEEPGGLQSVGSHRVRQS